ncbi:DNA polymerase ligase N-terminal domain-containing protein [Pirellulales bacterium]|nr:DNA polymerase ligase N-terminal domain-containing protein [Pirellulales bacterium]
MPRFVLLHHEYPPPLQQANHWDFMLEAGEKLATWRLAELPNIWADSLGESAMTSEGDEILAFQIADHRTDYLEYEGPIGDNRGAVVRCDGGDFEIEAWTDERCRVMLCGATIQGRAELRRIAGDRWQLIATVTGEPDGRA